jgi:hypothetical protein
MRWLLPLALLLLAGPAFAQGPTPGLIASGYSGFGYSSMAGTIGHGASFNGMGYVFLPGVGLVPAFSTMTTRFPNYAPRRRGRPLEAPEPNAELRFKLPPGALLAIDGKRQEPKNGWVVYKTGPLPRYPETPLTVRLRLTHSGKPTNYSMVLHVWPGARLRRDFTLLSPVP